MILLQRFGLQSEGEEAIKWRFHLSDKEEKYCVIDIHNNDDYLRKTKVLVCTQQLITVKRIKDFCAVILVHVAVFWFLASNWQAPNKVEQLMRLQKKMPQKIKAYMYQAPTKQPVVTLPKSVVQVLNKHIILPEIPIEVSVENKTNDEPVEIKAEKVSAGAKEKFDIKAITQSYLQRQQLNQQSSELQQYQYSTISEMTPQMKQEWLPARKTFAEVKNLHHQFDPNRIIREGHECFRVVKIIDPIAGDSENLGYKFKCGKTEQEKALAASLDKYSKKKR